MSCWFPFLFWYVLRVHLKHGQPEEHTANSSRVLVLITNHFDTKITLGVACIYNRKNISPFYDVVLVWVVEFQKPIIVVTFLLLSMVFVLKLCVVLLLKENLTF